MYICTFYPPPIRPLISGRRQSLVLGMNMLFVFMLLFVDILVDVVVFVVGLREDIL